MKFTTENFLSANGGNLLLTLPVWESVDISSAIATLKEIIDEEQQLIEQIAANLPLTFAQLDDPLAEVNERCRRLWGPLTHLNSCMQTAALRVVCEEGDKLIAIHASNAGMHEGLYRAYVHYRDNSPEYKTLDIERKKIVNDKIEDSELAGVALVASAKEQMTLLRERESELSNKIESNVKDAVSGWGKHIENETLLSGIPDGVKEAMVRQAKAKNLSCWYLTLHAPIYIPVMAHATNRELRRELFVAFITRASDKGPLAGTYDNMPLIEELLLLRKQEATLLGKQSYVELALMKRMAPSASEVKSFLENLISTAKTKGSEEFETLKEFAKQNYGLEEIMPWDLAFVSDKLQKHLYDFSEEDLRPYLTEERVLNGVFELVNKLFGAHIKEKKEVSVWRTGVKFFELYDERGELRGGFYADLFTRDGKNQGAWMDVVMNRRITSEGVQLPVASLNCNFTEPSEGEEALMTHSEVETIFHEFGHVLHHLFAQVDNPDVSMMNVEWDAVECPSQITENWAWHKSTLKQLSRHHKTGEILPDVLCDKLLASRYFQSAMMILRQLEFALVDIYLHEGLTAPDPLLVLDAVRQKVRVTPVYKEDRGLASFTHIFAGGYAAGYYSYLWAELIAADLYEAFLETGDPFNRAVGKRFLTTILEVGSSRPFMESYKEFRGRPPEGAALLRARGLTPQLYAATELQKI